MRKVCIVILGLVILSSLVWSNHAMAVTSDPVVKNAQQKLTDLGYTPGTVDGKMGQKTEEAIRKFQQDNNLTITGTLNEETLGKLGIETQISSTESQQEVGNDIDGWEQVKWGMTHAEVSKLYRLEPWDAKKPLRCAMEGLIIVPSYNHKGARVQLALIVFFEFEEQSPSGLLNKVIVSSISMAESDVRLWDDMAKSLVTKYGKPNSEKSKGEQGPNTKTWVRPSGQLKFLAQGGSVNYCEMEYTPKKQK